MTTLSAATRFNAEATLYSQFVTTVTLLTRPSWLPTLPAIVTNWPDIASSLPCFAIAHLPGSTMPAWQGQVAGPSEAGRKSMGLMEVSCFVTMKDNPNYPAQLRTMRDMVMDFVLRNPAIRVSDYQSDPTSPAQTGYKIDLAGVDEVSPQDDPNPAIKRARVLINYSFVIRAS